MSHSPLPIEMPRIIAPVPAIRSAFLGLNGGGAGNSSTFQGGSSPASTNRPAETPVAEIASCAIKLSLLPPMVRARKWPPPVGGGIARFATARIFQSAENGHHSEQRG